jgi:PBP1b-binding outer membrane lipoprotein LpoB
MKVAMKILALAAASALALTACATAETTKNSYTPQVEVVVKGPRAKQAQANYRTSPEDSSATGAGGSAK